jgi:hypothetical protein
MFKSPLPKWDMIRKFMHKKFDSSTHGCAILFICTTTSISLDQALEFFYSSPTPSPSVTTSLPFSSTSSTTNISIFVVDHARENPYPPPPRLMKLTPFVILWALSPTLEGVDDFINT